MDKLCYFAFGLKTPFNLIYPFLIFIFFNPLSKLFENRYFRLFVIFLVPTFIFIKLIRNDPFFVSDDFYHLLLASKNNYLDILNIALSKNGITVNHHIFLAFWLFKAIFDFFKVNPIPYYWVMFFINLGNGILFYLFLCRILLNKKVVALFTFIFGFYYISWISNIHEVLALTFTLTLLLFYISWINKFNIKKFIFSILLYIAAIFTKEITFLIFPIMILITVVLNLGFKKNIKYLGVFLILFVLYSIFYARGFFSYFGIAKGTGYSMSLSMPLIYQNLKLYLSLIISGVSKKLIIPFIFLTFLIYDIYSKKLKSILFLFSYLLLISPALLFSGRSSSYYNYIPLVFLLIGIGIIFEEIIVKISIIKKGHLRNLISVIFIIFVFGLFNLNIKTMDNCFLIQHPWKNSSKDAYLGLLKDIDNLSKAGKLKKGAEIKLTPDIDYPLEEMQSEVIKTFLDKPEFMQYTYEYIQEKGTVIIQ